jgi:hypothetical protein
MNDSNQTSSSESGVFEDEQRQENTGQQPMGEVGKQLSVESTPTGKKGKKWLLPGLLSLVVIALGVVGYFVYQDWQLKKEVPSQEQVSPTPAEELPTPTIDPTAGWQSYNNDEYKFSFKYPSDYLLSDKLLKILPEDTNTLMGITIINEEKKEWGQPPRIGLSIVQTEKSPKGYLDYTHQRELASWEDLKEERKLQIDKPYIISEENVHNMGVAALRVERQRMPTGPNSRETWYLARKNNLLYILNASYGVNPNTQEDRIEERNTLNSIFLTFKFTDSATESITETSYSGSQSVLFIEKNVKKHDDKGNALTSVPSVDMVIVLPEEVVITDKRLITTDEAKYQVRVIPAGLCPWVDDGSGCTYVDEGFEVLGENAILRLWSDDNRGIFALNFQSLNVNGYYIDHFEVFKEYPSETFSEQEVTLWKGWVEQIETIPSSG